MDVLDIEAYGGGSVSPSGGAYFAGTSLQLKATAAKGWVFAGWRDEGGEIVSLQPSFAYGVKSSDVLLSAEFIRLEEDRLWISWTNEGNLRMNVNETCSFAFADLFGVESGSLPTITVKGLPTGLKYDAKAQTISGKATKTGIYWVTVSAKNAGGYAHSVTVKWTVGYPSATDTRPHRARGCSGFLRQPGSGFPRQPGNGA